MWSFNIVFSVRQHIAYMLNALYAIARHVAYVLSIDTKIDDLR